MGEVSVAAGGRPVIGSVVVVDVVDVVVEVVDVVLDVGIIGGSVVDVVELVVGSVGGIVVLDVVDVVGMVVLEVVVVAGGRSCHHRLYELPAPFPPLPSYTLM